MQADRRPGIPDGRLFVHKSVQKGAERCQCASALQHVRDGMDSLENLINISSTVCTQTAIWPRHDFQDCSKLLRDPPRKPQKQMVPSRPPFSLSCVSGPLFSFRQQTRSKAPDCPGRRVGIMISERKRSCEITRRPVHRPDRLPKQTPPT